MSITASICFTAMAAYTLLLKPLTVLEIFAWRVVWTLPTILAVLVVRGELRDLRTLIKRVICPGVGLPIAVCALLSSIQQWLFLWAPLNGRALDVSQGYFLLPVMMVLVGVLLDREVLSRLQWCAVLCAVGGVTHEFLSTLRFAWPTLIVAFGLPPYFVLRRRIKADSMSLFCVETGFLLPVALAMICKRHAALLQTDRTLLWALLPGLGIISTVATATYLRASRLLPLGLFGLLGYLEPVLLVIVSVLIMKESFSIQRLLTSGPVALSAGLAAVSVLRAQNATSAVR
nr:MULTISPECIES: EamA family transporter RarD [unclassified Caballeronia]